MRKGRQMSELESIVFAGVESEVFDGGYPRVGALPTRIEPIWMGPSFDAELVSRRMRQCAESDGYVFIVQHGDADNYTIREARECRDRLSAACIRYSNHMDTDEWRRLVNVAATQAHKLAALSPIGIFAEDLLREEAVMRGHSELDGRIYREASEHAGRAGDNTLIELVASARRAFDKLMRARGLVLRRSFDDPRRWIVDGRYDRLAAAVSALAPHCAADRPDSSPKASEDVNNQTVRPVTAQPKTGKKLLKTGDVLEKLKLELGGFATTTDATAFLRRMEVKPIDRSEIPSHLLKKRGQATYYCEDEVSDAIAREKESKPTSTVHSFRPLGPLTKK